MKNIISLAISFFMFNVFTCNNINHSVQYEKESLKTVCTLNKMRIEKLSNEDHDLYKTETTVRTWIYGKISVYNSSDSTTRYNLRNYYLSLDGRRSSKIYINSFVDIAIQENTLKPYSKKSESVYWVFDYKISKDDIKKIELVVNK